MLPRFFSHSKERKEGSEGGELESPAAAANVASATNEVLPWCLHVSYSNMISFPNVFLGAERASGCYCVESKKVW